MMKTIAIALAALFLPTAAMSAPAEETTAKTVETAAPATETLRGVVESVDERGDTIRIRTSPEAVEPLKVMDGLLFDAVRYGDRVEVSVQEIAGAKIIVRLISE
jgi:hypothetical protein